MGIVSLTAVNYKFGGAAAGENHRIRVGLLTKVSAVTVSAGGDYQLTDQASGRVISDLQPGDTWQISPEGTSQVYILSGAGMTAVSLNQTGTSASADGIGKGIGSGTGSSTGTGIYAQGAQGEPVAGDLSAAFLTGEESVSGLANGISVFNNGESEGTFAGPLVLSETRPDLPTLPANTHLFTLNDRQYRGSLEFRLDSANQLTVVNELPLEQYLYSVVPSEMPSSWPGEALKAQAVAARNYALQEQESGRFAGSGFDVAATELSQVYKGYSSESDNAREAVDSTTGMVMLYAGKLINAVYHSSSGGYTENSEDVWSNPVGYLRAKTDALDANSQHYNWVAPSEGMMTADQICSRLRSAKGWQFAAITGLVVEKMSSTGARIQVLRIEGTDGAGQPLVKQLYNADSVRSVFGLKSGPQAITLITGADGSLAGVQFKGSGWGHGLGMSQWGARGMAASGMDYRSILSFYYTGIDLVDNYGE